MMAASELNGIYNKYGDGDSYRTRAVAKPPMFPTLSFYRQVLCGPFRYLFARTKNDRCNDAEWAYSSAWCADILEKNGGDVRVDGLSFIREGPYVFIANHMSTLETFFLPGMIRPHTPVTFVVKKSLTTMPFFGRIMRSRQPVVVGRRSPREDLRTVMEGGIEKLRRGVSIIVFPQSTRSMNFQREHFNTIGVKLARKAGVPIIPVALKTDAWGQGSMIKDFGRIRVDLPARFRFGAPVSIVGNGKREHAQIAGFIEENITAWQKKDGVNNA